MIRQIVNFYDVFNTTAKCSWNVNKSIVLFIARFGLLSRSYLMRSMCVHFLMRLNYSSCMLLNQKWQAREIHCIRNATVNGTEEIEMKHFRYGKSNNQQQNLSSMCERARGEINERQTENVCVCLWHVKENFVCEFRELFRRIQK